MNKADIVYRILGEKIKNFPVSVSANAYAPTNIALCKYWGKRNSELNLPMTSSLSISLKDKGTCTEIKISDTDHHVVLLNKRPIAPDTSFYLRIQEYLSLFRFDKKLHFHISSESNIPTAAGLASSASGFASLVLALDKLFNWELSSRELSILARLGSGSACRSIWQGFVEWHKGVKDDGMDSYGQPISTLWPGLCIGLLIISQEQKSIGSREAMQQTMATSPFYNLWPTKVAEDLTLIKESIANQDFNLLGQISESNAMSMHATMLSAWPPICYALPETVLAMHQIWKLRKQGVPVYFTQDAGPNLKLLFLNDISSVINSHFPKIEILNLFN